MNTQQHSRGRAGFTVVELLASLAVVAMLVALLLPAIQRVRESARRVQCASRLKQVGLALQVHAFSQQRLPAGWRGDPSGAFAFGWASPLLPYLDEQAEWERMNFQGRMGSSGVNFLWADGRVQCVSESIETRIYRLSARRFQ